MAESTTTGKYKVIGTRPIRHDGADKVTGRAKYGADYTFPGMLHGKVLRSPHAHAIIKSINFDKALKLPGVKAIVTHKDLPSVADKLEQAGEMAINPHHLSLNILAHDRALYDGHAIAAVAAINGHIAEEAVRMIEVEYEVLPPVMTVDDAMKPGATILHKGLRNQEEGDKQTNVAQHYQFKRGDVAEAFKGADYIVEREFKTAMVHQGYIEPHNAVGIYSSDGTATIYCSTQGPFEVRSLSAQVLGMPVGKIRVVPAEIGGGFGGKTTVYLEPLSVLLSKKTGAPVKMVMTRAEVLRASGPTSGSKIKVKMGATKAGKLVAAEIWMAYEAGAFPGSPVGAGAMCIITPYKVENFLIDAYDVVCNRPKTAAYRAPGATNAAFASETVIDELAEKCGIDPIDFRIQNGVKEGDLQTVGPPFKRIGFIQTCEAIKNSDHYKSKLTGKNRGRGVASGFWFNAGMNSSATVNIHADGTASVVTGSPDIGGSRASMAMITAEVLGLSVNEVRPVTADTDSIGHTDVTGGSRVTFATGMAVYEAAQDAVKQMINRASKVWEKKPEEVEFRDGKFFAKGNGVPPMTIKDLAPRLSRTGGPITGRASVNGRGVGPGFATTCVDVEVDPETGKVQILRATIAQDAGKAIHPSYVEGQMQGGTAQGLGWGLNEEYFYDDKGILRNSGLLDYRMPTCLDLPMIETCIVEEANPGHPLGVRGVGEASIIPPPAALANAIYRAVGVRMLETPMSPPKVLKAILKHQSSAHHSAAAD
ncbi:MAG: xanthine dehydrogenase family protein molybdopterin-binding subunit [Candidatus Binatus sp.]|uniref:xanthine dehydrogenase family protein molybdopterin-binding subunit n=1 Tax=Candidatus Binatus sp. TaxID=2811406 RepID=UPI00271BA609|nr:xanthine dehydrogenase family protein molybdopterin-binding subunit [Candidatus Binatus sp.]MDO8432223.1 xanthine dehydrogenase family protein molybdopterin-binding subunit [Candidatus Binatus sp.]